jgi:ATP-dependent DNA ligase
VRALAKVDVAALWPVEVMLAAAVEQLPTPKAFTGWQAELKVDGWRTVLYRGARECRVQSRRGTDLTAAFPDLAAAAAQQLPPGTVLDGEAAVWVNGGLDFSQLQRRYSSARAGQLAAIAPASFMAFDVLVLAGRDLRARPLVERRAQLEAVMQTCQPPLQLVPATTDHATATGWHLDYAAADVGIEGLVLKKLTEPYRPGARGWRKYRSRHTSEALVGAVTGPLRHPGRLVLALPDGGQLRVVGGTVALNDAQAREVGALLRPPVGEHPWPARLPSGRTGVWGSGPLAVTLVDPVLAVEVSTDTAAPPWRHLVRFVRPRPDLTAVELGPVKQA